MNPRKPVGPNYHRLARAHLKGLCAEFKVTVPRLYTRKWRREWGNKFMGVYLHDSQAIYINLKAHEFLDQLYDTIAHELAHHVTRHREAADHGPQWKDAAKRFGAKPKGKA